MSTKADSLSRLLGGRLSGDAAHASQTIGVQPMTTAKVIDISRIVPDENQPRRSFDDTELDQLAGSLRDIGQTDPVKVRWDAARDRFVLIDGERRFRAATKVGLKTLSAVVDNRPMTSDRVLEFQLVENALRTDLTPLEAGAAYRQLMAVWSVNQQQLAQRLHISESKVSRAIAALTLPTEVQQAVEQGKVGATTAVKVARKRPTRRAKAKTTKPVRLTCPAGTAVVTVKPGHDVVEVLTALLEQARGKAAA